jgi:hypothetical protein
MSGVRLIVAIGAPVMGIALAGCSSMPPMPDWMPDWFSSKPPAAQVQPLRFESDPPGADVRTAQGQTCLTPCTLSVPSEPQAVTITKVGFVPQTIQVNTGQPPEHSFWESPPPTLVPNPVQVVLQAVPPPPKPVHKRRPKPHGSASRTRTAGSVDPQSNPAAPPASSQFPPPTQDPATSPFPPPTAPRQ